MVDIFLKFLNMSITASWMIVAVMILRLILRRAPKYIRCLLWCMVGIRLLCPFSIESAWSLIPTTEVVTQELLYSPEPQVETGVPVMNDAVNVYVEENLTPNVGDSVNPLQILTYVASVLWLVGMCGLMIYAVISYLRVRYRVREAILLRRNIFQSERVHSPFVLGVIRTRIYVPFHLYEDELECVIAHEEAHIKRGDHLLKPLGFFVLAVYWFNPLIWVAYVLLCRDIELACDEKVIREKNVNKKLYSETLLNCSVGHSQITACPLAFGEVGVKHRIKNVVNYKKPAFWVMIVSVLLCVVLMVCFMTDPKEGELAVQTGGETQQAGAQELIGEAIGDGVTQNSAGETVGENVVQDDVIGRDELDNATNEAMGVLTSPPTMLLHDSLSSNIDYFSVTAGTYSWNRMEEDGQMVGVEACGMGPTVAVKGQEWLGVRKYNKLDKTLYTMNWEVTPDRITVRIYDLLELGKEEPDVMYGEETYEDPFAIELEPRRIYEVYAEWDEEDIETRGFYGNAYYIFATDNDWENGEIALATPKVSELEVGDAFTEEVNNLEGVSMLMEKYKSTEGDVEIVNTTNTEYTYGEYYDIQVQKDGVWYSLKHIIDNAAFHARGIIAPPNETSIWQVNWEWLYGQLPAGEYRIVKDILDIRAPGDLTKYYLAAEFEIKESE